MENHRAIIGRSIRQWVWLYPDSSRMKWEVHTSVPASGQRPLEAFYEMSQWDRIQVRFVRPYEIVGPVKGIEAGDEFLEAYSVVELLPRLGGWCRDENKVVHYLVNTQAGSTLCGIVLFSWRNKGPYANLHLESDEELCCDCQDTQVHLTNHWHIER